LEKLQFAWLLCSRIDAHFAEQLKILANIASSELVILNRDSARNAVSKEQSSMMEAAGTSSRSRESHPVSSASIHLSVVYLV